MRTKKWMKIPPRKKRPARTSSYLLDVGSTRCIESALVLGKEGLDKKGMIPVFRDGALGQF